MNLPKVSTALAGGCFCDKNKAGDLLFLFASLYSAQRRSLIQRNTWDLRPGTQKPGSQKPGTQKPGPQTRTLKSRIPTTRTIKTRIPKTVTPQFQLFEHERFIINSFIIYDRGCVNNVFHFITTIYETFYVFDKAKDKWKKSKIYLIEKKYLIES